MSRHVIATIALAVLALAACEKREKSTTETSAASQPATPTASTMRPEGTTAITTSAPPTAATESPKQVESWKGFSTPESVLFDDATDQYLVSNVDGDPLAQDGKGFISKIAPDGRVTELKWIESGKKKVTLNAPKGMVIADDLLYVADIDTVRMFDRKSGEPKGEVKVPGATFLNDVVLAPDGRVYVSDTGMKSGAKGMEPSGSDAVYAIGKDKKLTTIAKDKNLGGPNGLSFSGGKLWVATFGSGEIYMLDEKGKKQNAEKLPKGSLDGLYALPGGDVLVSSWDASAVYRGRPGGPWREFIKDVKSPADFGYDTKRNRVLVPLFNENEVRAFEMK